MEDPFASQREQMVAGQIARRGILDPRLLAVLQEIPRHLFVPTNQEQWAYEDGPLSIGLGQTISQPYIVALMTSLLELNGGETVLEIGTGSGYQAAILGMLARRVISIERHPALVEQAHAVLLRLGYRNISVYCADGTLGWPEEAPFSAIIVTAAAAVLPQPLTEQLAQGGRLVAPVGGYTGQMLQAWTKEKSGLTCENIIPVSFVPLRGKYGWSREDWSRYNDDTDL